MPTLSAPLTGNRMQKGNLENIWMKIENKSDMFRQLMVRHCVSISDC